MRDLSINYEREIWQTFRLGDRNAFESLLNQYYTILLNYGQRLVKDNDFAQDCIHDFFIDLWNQREKLDTPQSVKAYLLTYCSQKI